VIDVDSYKPYEFKLYRLQLKPLVWWMIGYLFSNGRK